MRMLWIIAAIVAASVAISLGPGMTALAQDRPTDRDAGQAMEIQKERPGQIMTSQPETVPGEIGKEMEKPLSAPEREAGFFQDLKNLKVPDKSDLGNSRESGADVSF
jgi:hypothetical protein